MEAIIKSLLKIFILAGTLSGCAYEVSRPVVMSQSSSSCEEKHGYCTISCEHEHSQSKVNREKCYAHCIQQLGSCRETPPGVVVNPRPSVIVEPAYAPVVVEPPYPYWGWGYAGGYHHHHWR